MGLSGKKKEPVYWKTKDDKRINVDDMTEEHLRNVLKLIIKRSKERNKKEDLMDLYYEFLAEDYGDR